MSTTMPPPATPATATALTPLPQLPAFTDYSLCAAPTRKIYTQDDVPAWVESETYHLIETIILRLSVAVDGKTVEDPCHESQATKTLVDFLQKAESWVDDIPLQTSPQRFGNKAFREWIAMLEKSEQDLQLSLLTPTQLPILPELSHHFVTSFGSPARLDYGTGHELSFLAYLLILRLSGTFTEQDEQAMVTRVFAAYLTVVRKLQKVFKLEPAGSKGVWGLDDHQHLVYLWGASQLRTHPTVRPSSILAPQSISPLGISYLFLSSILHVNDLKTGPFAEHSPLLHNIASTVPNWTKVSTGLLKMYREEVLKKVPVVQHFWFGGVLGWRKATLAEDGNLVDPFRGSTMESSGDHLEEEDKEAVEQLDQVRERDEGTVAPWALPSLSGSGHNSPVRNNSAAPRSRHTSTASSSSNTSSSNGTPNHSTTGTPIPPRYSPTNPSPSPQPFVPPALFPLKRRGSLLGMGAQGNGENGGEGTVADEGGAAAASSPFGVLGKASLGRS